jgi:hypothetical protein
LSGSSSTKGGCPTSICQAGGKKKDEQKKNVVNNRLPFSHQKTLRLTLTEAGKLNSKQKTKNENDEKKKNATPRSARAHTHTRSQQYLPYLRKKKTQKT